MAPSFAGGYGEAGERRSIGQLHLGAHIFEASGFTGGRLISLKTKNPAHIPSGGGLLKAQVWSILQNPSPHPRSVEYRWLQENQIPISNKELRRHTPCRIW